MENTDATELAESADSPFKTYCALMVSVLAMVLAINNLGGSNTGKEATMNNILAANMYSFYQAKNVRQTQYKIAADELEMQLSSVKSAPEQTRIMKDKLEAYRKTIDRYESEPDSGEGKKELLAKAKHEEELRDLYVRKDPWFDYGAGLLQIAIVLASVAIVINSGGLLSGSLVVGILGVLSALNGFFLFV